MGTIETTNAVEELREMRAVALGYSAATNGSDSKVKLAQRSLIERGYPEIVEHVKDDEEE